VGEEVNRDKNGEADTADKFDTCIKCNSPPINGQCTRYHYYTCSYIYIIMHAFIRRASSVMILNQRRWQSLGGQHGKGVDGLFEKVSFQTAFKGVESG